MTLIVGIKTVEGIVLGSDSAATFGAGWTYTIGQMDMKKVHILGTNKDVIFGSTGSVGMAQLISNKIEVEWNANNYKGLKQPQSLMDKIGKDILSVVGPYIQSAQCLKNLGENHGGSMCKCMVAIPVHGQPHLFGFDFNGAPEQASEELPFVSMGSGSAFCLSLMQVVLPLPSRKDRSELAMNLVCVANPLWFGLGVLDWLYSPNEPDDEVKSAISKDQFESARRLPETIIVDWGPENVNAQMQRACRIFGVHIRQRPKGQPRAGSVLERLFGTTHTQFIHLLEGNTKVRKHYRMVTKAVRPENFAAWTLVALHGALEEYFEELYGKNPHPAHGAAPVEYFNQRFVETGERRHRMLRFDRLFKIETCPEPHDGPTRQVDRHRGIKVNYIWYWADEFKDGSMDGAKVQVRLDPWDPGVVFALIGHIWVDCTSKYRSLLSRMTWVELRYALHEIRHRLGAKESPLTPERVEEWMRALDPKNFDARLAAEQSEMRMVYQSLDMANINPSLPDEGSLSIRRGDAPEELNGDELSRDQEGEKAGQGSGSNPEPGDQEADQNPNWFDDDYPLI